VTKTTIKQAMEQQRTCYPCTLCCTVTRVPELDKPERVTCPHCAKDCTVYEDRPQSCRTFQCEWLKGQHTVELRPDLSHIVLEKLPGVPVVIALIEPGFNAALGEWVTAELQAYGAQGVTVMASNGQALLAEGHTPAMVKKFIVGAARHLGVLK
jgi:hypothetical protein